MQRAYLWGYFIVLGARTKDDKSALLIYRSDNLYNWKLYKEIVAKDRKFGYMWGCPDLFKLNGENVMIFSPQGLGVIDIIKWEL
ncbi:glycoside hydrolase family 32 protein [Clostridium septicum]|uniref:Glycosyl hydrolase family 32 N-terminal domain-containing protein n=1 Tax=Clostridium septicum TaxID=1504 RepID=A0ABY5B288_CLOSE|nr:glycoside hydrolase family 32 protein [Clostridium septicum]MDU1313668.1 glycoside hydrolase family 32 protein [Clostridium septicum]UEC20104.1 hypothetical protein LK444_11905 [Clostridium septicum]USS01840.1 hypothetical protein NH397_05265 [Clostridium septicum]WLF70412.1 glycoside hydrolase family 32 protein [Clostridium septicum]